MEGKTGEETSIGLVPNSLSSVIDLLDDPSLEKRKMALNSLINARPGEPGYENLFENDIFRHLIESFSERNIPVIGTVCTAYRSIAFLNPSEADKYTLSIPLSFLLSVKSNIEVIDFLSTQVLNSLDGAEGFPGALVSSPEFPGALSNWLKSENEKIIQSALDLVNSCAMCNPEMMDFSFVTGFTAQNFSPDIRALALNIITLVKPEENIIEQVIALLKEVDLGTVFFEIVHDMYQSTPDDFAGCFELLMTRCLEKFELPPAALTIADASNNFNELQQKSVADRFFELEIITPEHCFALYSVASINKGLLGEREYMKLLKIYKKLANVDTMMAVEKIITLNREFSTSEVAQQCYLGIMKEGAEYAMHEIEFLVDLFEEEQMIPELVQEMAHFKEDNSDKLTELMAKLDFLIST